MIHSISRMKSGPTAHDLSVGVGWQYAMREGFGCRMRRRLGPLRLRKALAPKMMFNHFHLISSALEIR